MEITSHSFLNNNPIPNKFGCSGKNINPEIIIQNVPKETKSLALIMEDPDAPRGVWTHWILLNIDPKTQKIGEGESIGITGTNDYGNTEYNGPCPPSGIHRYFFKIFALDKTIEISSPVEREDFYKLIEGHIIDKGELMGTYSK